MAIGFARLQFVKRSEGKNSCAKSAYNARDVVNFKGNEFSQEKVYDWSSKEKPEFHDILLPSHVNSKFKNAEVLWNAIETIEKRKDSQTAMELVLALPDDKDISLEDKIHLVKSFVEREFVKNGLGVQIDIHPPEKHKVFPDGSSIPEEKDHNWHAHVLVTTRQFDSSGEVFEKKKNRDLMPEVRSFGVVAGAHWGKIWSQHQNEFFEEKGLALRVDFNGAVAQIHLGPKRMRGRVLHLLEKQDDLIARNIEESRDPTKTLAKLTETQSTFVSRDVDLFFMKHLEPIDINAAKEAFWKQENIIQLHDKKSGKPLDRFTSTEVITEEKKLIRLADRLSDRDKKISFDQSLVQESSTGLNAEQAIAFKQILSGSSLSLIEGHAGTGKSHLMVALKKVYEGAGYKVRGLGPDNTTAQVLKDHGFEKSSNIHRFLYEIHKGKQNTASLRKGKQNISSGNEVWIVDEAGKLGNKVLSELLKKAEANQIKVILSGNSAQLPSVERGGMFKQFCSNYGCSVLENIQRQKDPAQREIAKKLATGEISQAFDAIASTGGFIWARSREDAMEALVKKWAIDKAHFPNSKSLMIAHSNVEVRALNELARNYLKESKIVSSKEFECQSAQGTIYVSEGDAIEFRKNDPVMHIMNGTLGVLTKASESQFVVSVNEKGKTRDITFDPKKFNSFQLGYATTYNRSQGQTIERGYILHSPYSNKEMFYVGLTRHIKSVSCFVSKINAQCLSDLKRQAFKSSLKESTLDYTSRIEIEANGADLEKVLEIDTLKNSSSLLDKAKGFGQEAFGIVKAKIGGTIEKYRDRVSDSQFYSYQHEKSEASFKVIEVKEEISIPKTDPKIVETMTGENQTSNSKENHTKDSLQESNNRKDAYSKLIPERQSLLKTYFRKSEESSSLYEISRSEALVDSSPSNIVSCQSAWKVTCTERNKLAHEIYTSFTKEDLKTLFSAKSLSILEDRFCRHETLSKPKVNINDELCENIEPLMCKLFPEGPSRKNSREFRFGANGSICVTHSGAKAGTYYDFERGEGGGMLKLIQSQINLNPSEAKNWATEFVNKAPLIEVTRQFSIQKGSKKEEEWVCVKPSKEVTDSEIKDVTFHLAKTYKLSATHSYRDADGNPLFYVLRLQNLENPSKKLPLPMSYGYWKGSAGEKKWGLKGYQSESGANPIYNLDLLYRSKNKPVLIVEGEKTADAANKLLGKDFVCISWQGGAGAASKGQWEHLFGREIIIWPDNDDPGCKASADIVTSLKKVGIGSLKVVDESLLRKNLPEKWDLADPLPEGKSPTFIKDCLLRANPKAIGLDRLDGISGSSKDKKTNTQALNEILWRVDDRLRAPLEQEHAGKTWDVENGIMKEVTTILKSEEKIKADISKAVGTTPFDDKLVHQAMVYRAKTGEAASPEFFNQAVDSIRRLSQSDPSVIKDHDFDKKLSALLEHGIHSANRLKQDLEVVCDTSKQYRTKENIVMPEKEIPFA